MPGESQDTPLTGRPDPTVMTTEQMLLAVKNLEKLVTAWLENARGRCDEKFASIETQLQLIERQRVEQKKDTKDAVDAALAAAKEAVKEQTTASQLATNKTESSFTDQLKQQAATYTLGLSAVTNKVDDLKERIGNLESRREERRETVVEHRETSANHRSNSNLQLVYASVLIAAAGVVVALVSVFTR